MAHSRVTDPDKLKALLDAAFIVESDLDLDSILERVVGEAVRLVGARYGALGVLDDDHTGLAQFVTVGLDAEEIATIGDPPAGRGVLGLLITDPEPIRLADIGAHDASVGFPEGHPAMRSFVGVPIHIRDTIYGNLYLTEKEGSAEFTDEDEDLLVGLAAAAAIAIENARLHRRVAELAMADDRERIARDLHDTVIQRLFAIGLSLQSVIRVVDNAEAARRLQDSVDDLDETIRQVRTAIFSLEAAPETRRGLRAQILDLTTGSATTLGFEPQVCFVGPIDSQVGEATAAGLITSLQEILDNVALHARATTVGVEVTLEKEDVYLEVTDDGVGIAGAPPFAGGRGVATMCERAEVLGGSCVIRNAAGRGTAIVWRAPA